MPRVTPQVQAQIRVLMKQFASQQDASALQSAVADWRESSESQINQRYNQFISTIDPRYLTAQGEHLELVQKFIMAHLYGGQAVPSRPRQTKKVRPRKTKHAIQSSTMQGAPVMASNTQLIQKYAKQSNISVSVARKQVLRQLGVKGTRGVSPTRTRAAISSLKKGTTFPRSSSLSLGLPPATLRQVTAQAAADAALAVEAQGGTVAQQRQAATAARQAMQKALGKSKSKSKSKSTSKQTAAAAITAQSNRTGIPKTRIRRDVLKVINQKQVRGQKQSRKTLSGVSGPTVRAALAYKLNPSQGRLKKVVSSLKKKTKTKTASGRTRSRALPKGKLKRARSITRAIRAGIIPMRAGMTMWEEEAKGTGQGTRKENLDKFLTRYKGVRVPRRGSMRYKFAQIEGTKYPYYVRPTTRRVRVKSGVGRVSPLPGFDALPFNKLPEGQQRAVINFLNGTGSKLRAPYAPKRAPTFAQVSTQKKSRRKSKSKSKPRTQAASANRWW